MKVLYKEVFFTLASYQLCMYSWNFKKLPLSCNFLHRCRNRNYSRWIHSSFSFTSYASNEDVMILPSYTFATFCNSFHITIQRGFRMASLSHGESVLLIRHIFPRSLCDCYKLKHSRKMSHKGQKNSNIIAKKAMRVFGARDCEVKISKKIARIPSSQNLDWRYLFALRESSKLLKFLSKHFQVRNRLARPAAPSPTRRQPAAPYRFDVPFFWSSRHIEPECVMLCFACAYLTLRGRPRCVPAVHRSCRSRFIHEINRNQYRNR